MIGFDLSDQHKTLRSRLLSEHHIFTGEAKPNVIRLLPALNISKQEIDKFLKALKEEIALLNKDQKVQVSSEISG